MTADEVGDDGFEIGSFDLELQACAAGPSHDVVDDQIDDSVSRTPMSRT